MKSGLGISVKKVNDYPLYFIAESSILNFVVVLAASLDINCLYIHFMIGANSLTYRICKYDLGNPIFLQNKSDNNNNCHYQRNSSVGFSQLFLAGPNHQHNSKP